MLVKHRATGQFGTQLKSLREAAGFTQEELATIAGLSVHAVSALERGRRRRPHVETVRALSAALELTGPTRDAFLWSARGSAHDAAADELSGGSLPLPPTVLLGREADVEALSHWLADPTARLITLVGPGGVGKTRLALELARGIVTEGTTRVVFVALAAIRDPSFVASAIAEALGLADATPVDMPTRARVATGDRPTLLVLDNFEHVLGAAPLVAELLISVAALRVLTTGRAPLRLRGEREYPVGPLPLEVGADDTSPADLARSPAVRLFVERIRDAQPEFRLTSANGATVTAICRRLDALPLALELAAPWIKVLTVEDLLRRLERDALLPAVGPRDLPERQQTMNATIAWSYQLLDSDEQRAFRRFGVLPCLFPIDAAREVLAGCGATTGNEEALRAAAALIDKSLLLRVESSGLATRPLYQMLETVRAYAGLELEAARERDEAMEGLVRYCAREASGAADGLVGPSQAEWLDRVRKDLESYRTALAWLIEHDRPAEASHIAWGLWVSWLVRGRAVEGLQWYEQILSCPSLPPVAEAKALVGAAMMCYPRGELERARASLGRALALSVGADAVDVIVQAENVLGHVERALGDASAASDRFSSSLDGFRKLGIPWGTGNALIGMAGIALANGDAELAERRLDEATSVLRQAGPWFLNQPLYLRAILAVRSGKPDAAIAWVRESLVCSRELHDSFAFVYGLVPLAAAAALGGNDAWAARILGARDAVTERIGVTVVDNSAQELRERTRREAASRLGPDRWTRAYTAGRGASIGSLLQDIDNALG